MSRLRFRVLKPELQLVVVQMNSKTAPGRKWALRYPQTTQGQCYVGFLPKADVRSLRTKVRLQERECQRRTKLEVQTLQPPKRVQISYEWFR